MHVKHQGLQIDASAIGRAVRRSGPDTLSPSSPTSLTLPHSHLDRGHLAGGVDTVAERRPVVPGQLTVRWERQDAMSIMWLSGALDQPTVTLLDREFGARATGLMGLVVDLTGLVFIDSAGLVALLGIQWRASRRDDRLSFRHGWQVAQRPVELTRSVRLRSRSAARASGVSDENFYFALAMACVDVDHPWSGDRPEAA
jgi:ABC-type transporter Mla MlaB component